jgi:hypothetical protein
MEMTPEQIEEMRADMAAGTHFWGDGALPTRPVPLSGLCLSLYSKASADMESAANTRRFLRVPTLEAEVLRLTEANAALAQELARMRELLADAVEDETEFETEWNKAARAALSHTGMTGQREGV